MFTGLIEEIGTVRALRRQGSGMRLTVEAHRIMDDVQIDDSIAINGACQTVVSRTATTFDVDTVEETLLKTTFGTFRSGKQVNLERAMKLGGRLGGHLVQGHVDTCGVVTALEERQGSWLLTVRFPQEYARYVIPVGSICIDGVSLTTARVEETKLTVAVIPHTWQSTTLHELRVGTSVNLEFDLIGKYIEKLLTAGGAPRSEALFTESFSTAPSASLPHTQTPHTQAYTQPLTESWLEELGYR